MQYPGNYPPGVGPPVAPRSNTNKILLFVLIGGCGCAFLMMIILAAIMFPVFAQAREKAREQGCMSNVGKMTLGMQMYVQDYDMTFPESRNWMAKTQPYINNPAVNHCPSVSSRSGEVIGGAFGYAFNSRLSKASEAKVSDPYQTGMIYDSSTLTESASDPLTSLPMPPRHFNHVKCDLLGFVDGHAQAYTPDELQSLLQSQSQNSRQ
jgi:hypothetical protein